MAFGKCRYGWVNVDGRYKSPCGRFSAERIDGGVNDGLWRLTDSQTWAWGVGFASHELKVFPYSQTYDSLRECVTRSEHWQGAHASEAEALAAGEAAQAKIKAGNVRVHGFAFA